ncbi:uncharacterized protein NEPG_02610 [Nematocida parisii ERTm1]|uniref:Uncharacterized protein n=1 Tax=Nematocida parisii (strain ERTm3) TaxID=935791 RepID=I3ED86_NEMP3|nr:uncharacterized protein NEPG_02610 [Nematocida parisii ERTm1]EIJ87183.1 hypothetical protein NEQG_02640 [Nematocida parisii ERTm3]EIJ92541.1 hypothetical protein NEPG_02610 [Nematocida parisii ERTm1]KAI5141219.1 hypothetical protein NEPAR04_0789 [Nematocida parisii]KAI5143057.1 hypothetical protein NEPAR04_1722 [Nematocida parisii]|eukprot:XP_013060437.1 hypothetical protein NEPG_02610 [Nematocida parisii ERTm1]
MNNSKKLNRNIKKIQCICKELNNSHVSVSVKNNSILEYNPKHKLEKGGYFSSNY